MSFTERLIQAAAHKGVVPPHSNAKDRGVQSAVATFLGVGRANVGYWVNRGGTPNAETYRLIAERLGVNRDWLETGKGEMLAAPSAPEMPELKELHRIYLKATPTVRSQIIRTARALAKAMLVMGPLLPPVLVADGIDHNYFYAAERNTHWINLLTALFKSALRRARNCGSAFAKERASRTAKHGT